MPRAIQCFQRQTYPNKELLILADGENVSDLAQGASGSDLIRYVHVTEGATIGEKRNLGSQMADGEIIISWDDDDWNSPDRVASQVDLLKYSQKSVASYHSMLFTDGLQWWKFKGMSNSNLGTSLCYLKSWWERHPFPHSHIGEDAGFIDDAIKAGQHVSTDAGELVVASIHPNNTSAKTLAGSAWQQLIRFQGVQGYQ